MCMSKIYISIILMYFFLIQLICFSKNFKELEENNKVDI